MTVVDSIDSSHDMIDRAAKWIRTYDAQGIHRSTLSADEQSAEWLAGEMAAIGGQVQIDEFPFDRVEPIAAYAEVDGLRIAGEPLFDSPFTSAEGIKGTLGHIGSNATIGLAEFSPHAVYDAAFYRIRNTWSHEGVILVTKGGRPGLALLNAEHYSCPSGPTVVQVSSVEHDQLIAAAERGALVRLVNYATRVAARMKNVVAMVKGTRSNRSPLVVMTPRTGWWNCASERGGGIVCWLEVLRALAASLPAADIIFTANSGHELGHIGLADFMSRRPMLATTATWLHFGANIGARDAKHSLYSAHKELSALGRTEMARVGQAPDLVFPTSIPANGESREVHKVGGRYITLVGSNPLFHLPDDRWPDAVDIGAVSRCAAAFVQVALALTR
jgi:hypothetical protein